MGPAIVELVVIAQMLLGPEADIFIQNAQRERERVVRKQLVVQELNDTFSYNWHRYHYQRLRKANCLGISVCF